MKMLIQELEKKLEPTERTQMFDENEKKKFLWDLRKNKFLFNDYRKTITQKSKLQLTLA